MTTPLHSTVKLTDPGDVLAAVPHLLGFHPVDSLVMITVHARSGSMRLGMSVRADLPAPQDRDRLVEHLVRGPISRQGAEAVILAVVGGGAGSPAGSDHGELSPAADPRGQQPGAPVLPHNALVGMLRETLRAAELPVVQAVWTAEIGQGNGWHCYDEHRCGVIADPATSSLAAAMAAAGSVTFASREELADLVASEPADSLARRAARLDAAYEDVEQERVSAECASGDLECVLAAVRRTAEGAALTEEDLVRVLIAVSDHRVRDLALSTALTEWAGAAEQLWLTLVRKAPAPEMAEAAALLAFSAYLRGDGALAGVALEKIESSRPEHRLGMLLRQALEAGIPPSEIAVIAKDAAEDARTLLDEEGAW
ncbi:uncharacterized protein DUF4192 [Halopolyspora algeriensis]|uniref:Uncharacterized protein DUF4192 n=1 Tax=Halopolyspora algeriensis TaxID=1500506 RepID=A0A368VQ81_9ACTN|nr:DUF4192 domain-containing protein [Halopolyspora algeriensis]RCW44009.1 uncharacterized protein DUF4192 [Halopolyspora algeriensis]TQM53488.1 uncharacterized protein DUF4192 [Halopolyspora algeriensis]